MSPADWTTLFTYAPNIVTAVIFGYFVLKLLERQDKRDNQRDEHDKVRDAEWRSFLADGRDQYVASVAAVTVEMKTLAATMGDVYRSVIGHDIWERNEMVNERQERSAAVTASAHAVKVAAEVVASALIKADDKRAAEKANN